MPRRLCAHVGGKELYEIGLDELDNAVDVVARGADEARLRAMLTERYGDAVRLTWEIGGATAC
jgi:hypothetical protein